MIFIELDAYEMIDKERTHEYIAEKFDIDYYGHTLEAMLEALIKYKYEVLIKIRNAEVTKSYLGDYGKQLIDGLNVAREKNDLLHIRFIWQMQKFNLGV